MRLPLLAVAAASLFPAAARAGWPDDVSVSGMTEHGGVVVVDRPALGEAWAQVVRELGTVVGTRTVLAPHTLGARGFEATVESTFSFTDVSGQSDVPDPWDRVHVNESGSLITPAPGITVRKGLPMSFEIGMTGRWLGMSRQGIFSAFVRTGLIEGFKPAPDINFHLGYSGYVGNHELDLHTWDAGFTIGSVYAVGPGRGAKDTRVSPYADVTLLFISAVPKVSPETRAAIGALAYGQRDVDEIPENNAKGLVVPQFSGGMQVEAGNVLFRVSGGYGLRSVANFGLSVGFIY